ncbi:hypothetical protein TrST_g13694 [Triparma strigata]|uniref:Uncharacterized protein n=1 Tax=Triparma strigata TaxID=1606541 RepID=A0A9W7EYB0_9STRA|nr:hypothetical protein TrST_g13694 [Triparma strigata]
MAALVMPHSRPATTNVPIGTSLWHARAAGICVEISENGIVANPINSLNRLISCSLNPTVKGLVWNRGQNPLKEEIKAFTDQCLPDGNGMPFAYEQIDLRNSLSNRVDSVNTLCSKLVSKLPSPLRSALEADALMLCSTLTSLCPSSPWLTVQLECVGHNNCSRWHQDMYVGRALISYTGPGTWLVDDRNVDFEMLEKSLGMTSEVSDRLIVPDRSKVHEAGTNSVCLLKGNSWMDIQGLGVTHKSPVVERDGEGRVREKRLVLKVDLSNTQPGI